MLREGKLYRCFYMLNAIHEYFTMKVQQTAAFCTGSVGLGFSSHRSLQRNADI